MLTVVFEGLDHVVHGFRLEMKVWVDVGWNDTQWLEWGDSGTLSNSIALSLRL